MTLIALDIETKARNPELDLKKKHALIPHLGEITVIGLWSPDFKCTTRSLVELQEMIDAHPEWAFVGHNVIKFDAKFLRHHGIDVDPTRFLFDTSLAATASYEKPTPDWLKWYEAERKKLNLSRKRGQAHREAGIHSLKTQAPFFLGVDPFWEPEDHDNDDYVLKDCEYSYRLHQFQKEEMKKQGTWDFYINNLIPWARMFLKAEERGITLDMDKLRQKEDEAIPERGRLKAKLDKEWKHIYQKKWIEDCKVIDSEVDEMRDKALGKLKVTRIRKRIAKEFPGVEEEKIPELFICGAAIDVQNSTEFKQIRDKIYDRHEVKKFSRKEKLELGVNFGSPKQMLWLLEEQLGLDCTLEVWDKETQSRVKKKSTGVEVIEKLIGDTDGREDLRLFLDYRKQEKLISSYFPSYHELNLDGVLHCNFNLDVTKTGRTSSSRPNLQQCPPIIRECFTARPGYKLITRDLSAIEPTLMAYYSEDPILCDILIKGTDFHSYCAKIFFDLDCPVEDVKKLYPKERPAAKTGDLSMFYGTGARKFKQAMNKAGFPWALQRATEKRENFLCEFDGVKTYKEGLDRNLKKVPMISLLGRKRSFKGNEDSIYMQGFNGLIQTSASDHLLDAALEITRDFEGNGIDGHLLLAVHDELVFEVREDQCDRAVLVIDYHMTARPLPTRYGNIPLKVEGSVSKYWEK